jgi:hypothetical protein
MPVTGFGRGFDDFTSTKSCFVSCEAGVSLESRFRMPVGGNFGELLDGTPSARSSGFVSGDVDAPPDNLFCKPVGGSWSWLLDAILLAALELFLSSTDDPIIMLSVIGVPSADNRFRIPVGDLNESLGELSTGGIPSTYQHN